MNTKLTSIEIKKASNENIYWRGNLENGGFISIWDNLQYHFNPITSFAKLGNGNVGDIFDVNPHVPIIVAEQSNGYLNLVSVEPINAIVKLQTSPYEDLSFRESQIDNAYDQLCLLVESSQTVYFDAETTGVDPKQDEFVSFAIKGAFGEYSTFVKPTEKGMKRLVENGAIDIHHITPDMLQDSPTFLEVYMDITTILYGGVWVVYNANYDVTMLDSLCIRHKCGQIPRLGVHCAMLLYAQYRAELGNRKNSWKWHKLIDAVEHEGIELGNAHNALTDTVATYELIQKLGAV